jgi:transcriptional regulator with XRE-family HTH domain
MKTAKRDAARHLRAQGCSIKEIERSLGVARSSVSRWVRDVELGEVERSALAARVTEGRLSAAREKAATARALRAAYQEEGRQRARIEGGSYAAGCMLYWAEGEKSRWSIGMSNSDVELLRLFATFLRSHFDVPDEAMRVHCHLYADHVDRQHAIERHWLAVLDLPDACLRKTMLNVTSKYSEKKRSNKLPYGTCKLRVHSTRIVQTIYGSIQEYGGFERAEWLG